MLWELIAGWHGIDIQDGINMHYCYILRSVKSNFFYIDSTSDLDRGIAMHNHAQVVSTMPHSPWEMVWYREFETEKEAQDFERYLKSYNGRNYVYKDLFPDMFSNGPVYRS